MYTYMYVCVIKQICMCFCLYDYDPPSLLGLMLSLAFYIFLLSAMPYNALRGFLAYNAQN